MAFDRVRVEAALREEGIPGRDYLEKILQVAIDLPVPPAHLLSSQLIDAINAALSDVEPLGPFDDQVWPDVYAEVIWPLVRHMRDVRRYAASIRGTMRDLGGQVAVVDALGLEAVRVFLPDVFARLQMSVDGLTELGGGFSTFGSGESPRSKQQMDAVVEAAGPHHEVVLAMIRRLFPAGAHHVGGHSYHSDFSKQWLRARRVAHPDILRLYLERIAGETLAALTDAERVWATLGDRISLEECFNSIDPARWQDIVTALEAYEDDFRTEHVVSGAVVLLNLLPDIPERPPRRLFDIGARLKVSRVVYRLVRSLPNPAAVETAVRQVLPEVTTLSAKLELVTDVGHREGAGHGLVSETAASELEREWRAEVLAATTANLIREFELTRVLYRAKQDVTPTEPPLQIDPTPEMTLALLRSARADALSQSDGTRAVRRQPRLAWDVLVELYGAEATLGERIEALRTAKLEGSAQPIELAEKYLAGWRPNGSYGDD